MAYIQSNPTSEGEHYAGFKVDKKSITGTELIEMQEPIPSFDQLNQNHLSKKGKPIKPVNRKVELPYKGECPHCGAGAPNEYIYDNNHKS